MTRENHQLNIDDLDSVAGGGIVDNVAAEAEASTNAFLKTFAESSQRFSVFINTPSSPPPSAGN